MFIYLSYQGIPVGTIRETPTQPWMILAVVLTVLGMNKQFHLLNAFTEIGRTIFVHLNWIEHRRIFQAALMVTFFITGSIFLICSYPGKIGVLPRTTRFVVIGAIYLVFFVIERSISLHQFVTFLNHTIAGVRINWIVELTGIYWVLFWLIVDSLSRIKGQSSGDLFSSETPKKKSSKNSDVQNNIHKRVYGPNLSEAVAPHEH